MCDNWSPSVSASTGVNHEQPVHRSPELTGDVVALRTSVSKRIDSRPGVTHWVRYVSKKGSHFALGRRSWPLGPSPVTTQLASLVAQVGQSCLPAKSLLFPS